MDTGGGLRRWQIDCYYGEDEPLGPGKLHGTTARDYLRVRVRQRTNHELM